MNGLQSSILFPAHSLQATHPSVPSGFAGTAPTQRYFPIHNLYPFLVDSQPHVVLGPLLASKTQYFHTLRGREKKGHCCSILGRSVSPGTFLGEDVMPCNTSHSFLWKGLRTYRFHSFKGRPDRLNS